MKDPRVKELAEILVNYSTAVKEGDVVLISAAGFQCLPLVKEIYALCLQNGAKYVTWEFSNADMAKVFYDNASEDQLKFFPQHRLDLMKQVDVYIGIAAPDNTMALAEANQGAMLTNMRTMRPITDQRVEHTRWVVTRYPTQAAAQDAKMSLDDYENYVFNACCIDWNAMSAKQDKLRALMEAADRVTIRSADTHLTLSIKGIPAIKCDGLRNMPDGEVYTAPIRDSVEGHIVYNCRTIYNGKEFPDVRLEFQEGKVVRASTSGNQNDLEMILNTDEGARYIGEFALGINPGIRRATGSILFDEKIALSLHTALGSCYNECPNGNKSAIHWDLIKILDTEGEIWFDENLIQKDGSYVHPDLLDLNP